MKHKIIYLACLLTALSIISKSTWFNGTCVKVHQGDVLEIKKGKNQVLIKLAGIVWPKQNQLIANQILKQIKSMVVNKQVMVQLIEDKKTDAGYLVAKVFVDYSDLSIQMLRSGYVLLDSEFEDHKEYKKAEEKARQMKIGIWSLESKNTANSAGKSVERKS
jgi:endonuclease YncB( thermonuclease family)